MSNRYQPEDSHPSTQEWAAPAGQSGQPNGYNQQLPYQYGSYDNYDAYNQNSYGYQQPGYQQPGYGAPAPKGGGGKTWFFILLAVLVAALVGVLAFFGGAGAFNRQSTPVTSVVVETHTLPRTTTAPVPTLKPSLSKPPTPTSTEPPKREYRDYAPDTGVTSPEFSKNVFDAFREEYRRSGKTDVTLNVYSPVMQQHYEMRCRGEETVYCEGGNNARVKIW